MGAPLYDPSNLPSDLVDPRCHLREGPEDPLRAPVPVPYTDMDDRVKVD